MAMVFILAAPRPLAQPNVLASITFTCSRTSRSARRDVSFFWYMNQTDRPAAPARGQLMDHVALSVANLDAWVEKLRAEDVVFLEPPYVLAGMRAVIIEGPSREAIELVEIK